MQTHAASPEIRPMAAPPGGVLTREVGAVTGDLEVRLDTGRGGVVRVRYAGALDEYTVVGSATSLTLDEVVAVLSADPGVDADGNPRASDLRRSEADAPAPADAQGDADAEPADDEMPVPDREEPGCADDLG